MRNARKNGKSSNKLIASHFYFFAMSFSTDSLLSLYIYTMKSKSKQDWAYDAVQHTAFHRADTFVGEEKYGIFSAYENTIFPSLNRVVLDRSAREHCANGLLFEKRNGSTTNGRNVFFFNPNGDSKRFSNSNSDPTENEIEKKTKKIDGKFSNQKHTKIVFLSKSTVNYNRTNEKIVR